MSMYCYKRPATGCEWRAWVSYLKSNAGFCTPEVNVVVHHHHASAERLGAITGPGSCWRLSVGVCSAACSHPGGRVCDTLAVQFKPCTAASIVWWPLSLAVVQCSNTL